MKAPTSGYKRELQVGVFVLTALLVVAAFSFRITDHPVFQRGTTLVTYLDDATGIFKKSKVKMAGIDIGFIQSIDLEEGRAKVSILIKHGVSIPGGAKVVPRPLGILGDKYLEVVVPKREDNGELQPTSPPSAPGASLWKWSLIREARAEAPANGKGVLKEGDEIKSVDSPATIDDVTRQMGKVTEDLKAISGSLRQLVEGEGAKVNSPIGRTLRNMEELTKNMNGVVVENRKELRQMISSLSQMATQIQNALSDMREGALREDIRNLTSAVGKLAKSLKHVDSILDKVDSGEGTLGKLVNDSAIMDELSETLASLNQLVDRASRIQMWVDANMQYNVNPRQGKGSFSLRILPREDYGYIGGLVVDPNGKTTRTETVSSTTGTEIKSVTEKDGLKFNLQFYKRVWDLAFRLGVFESSGGLALDYYFWNDRIRASAEVFEPTRENDNPHLRAFVRFGFLSNFYVEVGGDDFISRTSSRRSFMGGIGLQFNDDDLKTALFLPGLK